MNPTSLISRMIINHRKYAVGLFLFVIIINLVPVLTVTAQPDYWASATMISYRVNKIICIIWVAMRDIAGAIAALIFVFAGVQYVASQDDPGKRKAAKDTMIHCLIGLIIVVVADSIVNTVGKSMAQFTACDELITKIPDKL